MSKQNYVASITLEIIHNQAHRDVYKSAKHPLALPVSMETSTAEMKHSQQRLQNNCYVQKYASRHNRINIFRV